MFQKTMIFCVLLTSISYAGDDSSHHQEQDASSWRTRALSGISAFFSSERTEHLFDDQQRINCIKNFVEHDSAPYLTATNIKESKILDQKIPLYCISNQNPKDVLGQTVDISRGSTTYRFEVLEFSMKHNHPYLTEPLGIAGVLSAVYFFPIWSGIIFCGYVGGSFYLQEGNTSFLSAVTSPSRSGRISSPLQTEMSGMALLSILGFGKTLSEVMSSQQNPREYKPTFDSSGRFVYESNLNDGGCIGKEIVFRTVLKLKGTMS